MKKNGESQSLTSQRIKWWRKTNSSANHRERWECFWNTKLPQYPCHEVLYLKLAFFVFYFYLFLYPFFQIAQPLLCYASMVFYRDMPEVWKKERIKKNESKNSEIQRDRKKGSLKMGARVSRITGSRINEFFVLQDSESFLSFLRSYISTFLFFYSPRFVDFPKLIMPLISRDVRISSHTFSHFFRAKYSEKKRKMIDLFCFLRTIFARTLLHVDPKAWNVFSLPDIMNSIRYNFHFTFFSRLWLFNLFRTPIWILSFGQLHRLLERVPKI